MIIIILSINFMIMIIHVKKKHGRCRKTGDHIFWWSFALFISNLLMRVGLRVFSVRCVGCCTRKENLVTKPGRLGEGRNALRY